MVLQRCLFFLFLSESTFSDNKLRLKVTFSQKFHLVGILKGHFSLFSKVFPSIEKSPEKLSKTIKCAVNEIFVKSIFVNCHGFKNNRARNLKIFTKYQLYSYTNLTKVKIWNFKNISFLTFLSNHMFYFLELSFKDKI